MSNKLHNWINVRSMDWKAVMNLLQEYGVISDNCVSVKDVGNDGYAMKWLACNPHLLPSGNSQSSN
jgi:hypothetical protein